MVSKEISIYKDLIKSVNLDEISKYSNWVSEFGKNWFLEVKEHYKLLAYLSSFFNNEIIVDIGTYRGLSALALSYNSSNKIITYDIIDNFNGYKNIITPENKENIEFRIKDCRIDTDVFKNTNFVMLDVDPHDGIQERDFFKFFEEIGYEGIVVLDDIYVNKEMNDFWNNIKQPKLDLTDIGHWSGTGIVLFGNKINVNIN